jgi:flagellar basal-body rod protein FlgG
MVRGQYIAGTGMMLQRRMMETITNNITNVDTTGYKKENLVSHTFDAVMLQRMNDDDDDAIGRAEIVSARRVASAPLVGPMNYGTQIDQIYIDYSTGAFEETGRDTDMALVGDVFFVLETPDGERYSRAGAFLVDGANYLIDAEGNYVMGENGRIYVGSGTFSVDSAGGVYVNGQYSDTLRVVSFEDNNALRKQGGNLFFSADGPAAVTGAYEVKQKFLENSNVDVGREMVDMISVYRAYETNQRMLTMIDEIVGKAVNDIGRIR